jgi:DNA-binding MarR family transcriptional regulator
MSTRNLSKDDLEGLACFRRRLRGFLKLTKEASCRNGVTPMQYRLLRQLEGLPGREGSTVPELAACLQIKHHSATALISRCDAAGLVSTSAGRSDGRCAEVRLSPAGRLFLEHLAGSKRDESLTLTGCFFVPGSGAFRPAGA